MRPRLALVLALAILTGLLSPGLSMVQLALLCAVAFGDMAEVPWCTRLMARLDGRGVR